MKKITNKEIAPDKIKNPSILKSVSGINQISSTRHNPLIFILILAILITSIVSITTPIQVEASADTTDWNNVSAKDWMSCIDGSKTINNINMPGTHDSGTQYVTKGFYNIGQCQSRSIEEQLNIGVRFLDIRLKNDNDLFGKNLRLVHGTVDCLVTDDRRDKHLTFEHVLNEWVYPFLQKHPSETIVMSIKEQGGSTRNFNDELLEYIKDDPSMWITDTDVTTLDEARGKIVLMRRYKLKGDDKPIGIDFSNWTSSACENIKVNDEYNAFVQDKYEGFDSDLGNAVDQKWEVFSDMFSDCERDKYDNKKYFVLNFNSATGPGNSPRDFAHGQGEPGDKYYVEGLSKKVEKKTWQYGKKYGWVIMDFAGATMSKNIYTSNEYVPETPTLKYAGASSDDYNYYFYYDILDSGDKAGRTIMLERYRSENGKDYEGMQMMTTGNSSSSYYFTVNRKHLYAGCKYYFKIYQFTGDNTVSNVVNFDYTTDNKMGSNPKLTFPEWIYDGQTEVTAYANFTQLSKIEKIRYSVVDARDDRNVIVSGDTPELTSEAFETGLKYRADILAESYSASIEYIGDAVEFNPKRLGTPTNVSATASSYDSADISWNYGNGLSYDYFNVTVKKKSNGTVAAQTKVFSDGNPVEVLGLEPSTEYTVAVEAVGGELTRESSSAEFTTAEAPNLRVSPIVSYLANGSNPATLSTNFSDESVIEDKDITYVWQEKNRTKNSSYTTIVGEAESSIDYTPSSSDVMEVKCIATLTPSVGEPLTTESSRAFVYKAPSAPSSVSAEDIELTSMTLTWATTGIDGATGYKIEYAASNDNSGDNSKIVYVDPTQNSLTVGGLSPGTEYEFTVTTLGYSIGDKQAKSEGKEYSVSTLAEASIPTNVSIEVSPTSIASFDTDITYKAKATAEDGGMLSYQWQITTGSGIFEDIPNATDSSVTIKPSADNLNKKVRCNITNSLNGTTASATTPEKYIQFKPPVVDSIDAKPTNRIGAVSVDLTWKNPEMFEYYIVGIRESAVEDGKLAILNSNATPQSIEF